MSSLESVKKSIYSLQDKTIDFYRENPRTIQIALGLAGLYVANVAYERWKYSQKLFTKREDIENKVILITGCDTGFGNATALKLSIEMGYRVIATCLEQESIDQFKSNKTYTRNGSTAVLMDVTKEYNIATVKQFTEEYLQQRNDLQLWGVVNNAGFSIPGSFELVPKELAEYTRNVLYTAPINITRAFLPLIPGRKNWKEYSDGALALTKTSNNGGRIVNVTSIAARFIHISDIRYGPMKAALSYFSHALRMDLSPRFGIWVSAVEPGAYMTNITRVWVRWLRKIKSMIEENNEEELLEMYQFPDLYKVEKIMQKLENKPAMFSYSDKIDEVVDCIIHGLTAKYPQRSYGPNWWFIIQLFMYLPMWMTEPVQIKSAKTQTKQLLVQKD